MRNPQMPLQQEQTLRARALASLGAGASPAEGPQKTSAAALRVLHELAITPATAADALALLHELQVHQVELELQFDELSAIRTELEADLAAYSQRYDATPAALCTIDRSGSLIESNAACAQLLGQPHSALSGRCLYDLITTGSRDVLIALLGAAASGRANRTLTLARADGTTTDILASAVRDPAGIGFLIAFHGAHQG